MATVVATPLSVAQADKFPVVPIANGIVPDEALAITCTLQFSPTVQAILVDLSESARKFNTVPIQGAFVDTSGSTIDLRIDNSVTGQSVLAKAGLQGYYNLLCPMPAKLIAVLASAPVAQLNITVILYNTVIESEVWGMTTGPAGATGPQGPPGATGATGPQGPAGTISPATATVLGGVKIGSNVNVLADGTISVAAPYTLPIATATVLGGVKGGTGVSIAADGTISAPVLAPATNTVLGGVKVGTNVSVLPDGTISVPPVAAFQTPWLSNINGAGFNLASANQITATGPVGVGVASPLYQLDVRTPGATASQVHIASTNTDAGAYLCSSTDNQAILFAGASYNGSAYVAKATSASALYQNLGNFSWYADSGLTVGSTYSPTARMTITAAGNLGLGTPSPSFRLDVQGGRSSFSAASEQYAISARYVSTGGPVYFGASDGTATPSAVICNAGGAAIMTLTNAGGVGIGMVPAHYLQLVADDAMKPTTNTWLIASGAKVKKHVKRLKGGLEIINRLSPTEAVYNGKGGTPEGQRVVSLIAEEVREILPHTVTEDADGNLGFNIHEVIHHLILAVQQLSKKLEAVGAN